MFTLGLDGEPVVEASSIAVGFQWCKTGSDPALGCALSVSSPEQLAGSLCISALTLVPCASRTSTGLMSHLCCVWDFLDAPLPALGVASPSGLP